MRLTIKTSAKRNNNFHRNRCVTTPSTGMLNRWGELWTCGADNLMKTPARTSSKQQLQQPPQRRAGAAALILNTSGWQRRRKWRSPAVGQTEDGEEREAGSEPELTGHDDRYRTSPDSGGVLHKAGVISGIGIQRSDDTQHAFKRTHPRLAGSDFQPVRAFPSARQTTDNVFVQFCRRYRRPGYLVRSAGRSTTISWCDWLRQTSAATKLLTLLAKIRICRSTSSFAMDMIHRRAKVRIY